MKRVVRIAGLATVVGAMALAVVVSVNAQRGPMGGGPPGGRPQGMPNFGGGLESSWAAISFEIQASDEALVKIRKLYKDEYDAVELLRQKMGDMEPEGRRSAMEQIQESHTALLEDAKAHLTAEQAAALDKWHQDQMNRRPQWSGRGGGDRPEGGRPEGDRQQRRR